MSDAGRHVLDRDGVLVLADPPICDFCGDFIIEDEQRCPALDDGRCAP